jgi:hypothetical protein
MKRNSINKVPAHFPQIRLESKNTGPFISLESGVMHEHTAQHDLRLWPCPYGKPEMVFEGFVKCDGGLKHLVQRYAEITLGAAYDDVVRHGNFSPRPYRLGQACDGSTTSCALALFVRFCRECGLPATQLYRRAYPDEKSLRLSGVVSFAEWQGVAYPKRWNARAKAGLLESLHSVNYHSLASVVSDSADASNDGLEAEP